jgi:hypothetical protein
MSGRDWEAEMRKIDKQLESVADEALLPTKGAKSPGERAMIVTEQKTTSTLGVLARLTLSVALGVAIGFWPYSARCGLGAAEYLGAIAVLLTSGVWSSVWSWRHRAARAHILSLLLILWGLVLASVDVLPRMGWAKSSVEHPARWTCGT